MIWIFPAARAGGAAERAKSSAKAAMMAAARVVRRCACMLSPAGRISARLRMRCGTSERMSAVSAHHEEKLEQKLVGVREVTGIRQREMSEAVLATDLAKLAGPVGKNSGKAGVGEIGVVGVAAAVEAAADGPAA